MALRYPNRIAIVHGSLILFAFALIAKAGYEQLYRGRYWAAVGRRQHFASSGLPAPRGAIEDASGETLVESRELVRVSVAPREVQDRVALARAMRRAGIDPRWIRMATDTTRKWVDVKGFFLPTAIAAVARQHGVYAKPVMDRVYANSGGIRRIVGRVGPEGNALDGIELALDSLLRGDTASVRVARDKSGRSLAAPTGSAEALPGSSVTLTINRGLQDICDRALAAAVDSLHASGGDIVVMNPYTGEVLAMASDRSDSAAAANTAVTEPYEPGSTVKPFVAARLIALGKARPEETINTYGGHYTTEGRTINDAEEHAAVMSLSDVIKHSSNVGIVRFAERLSPREKFELLRDVGFGAPTAVLLPAESPGTLREPGRWSKQSAASVMMGYEVAVTPLQIVAAYSAIANGGELVAPQIVKEIRAADGTVQYSAHRRVVRRVMSPAVAATMRQMLRDVVAGGTSTKADLATLDVAGKSGTARHNVHGHYESGKYTASFVGLFPDDKPQFVVLVKLDDPQDGYYGGIVAGSVTNVVLRAALAARNAALNLDELATSVHAPRPDTSAAGRAAGRKRRAADSATAAAVVAAKKHLDSLAATDSGKRAMRPLPPLASVDPDPRTGEFFVVKLPAVSRVAPPASSLRAVPNVEGLPLRGAVRALHAAGFRVQLVRGGPPGPVPAAGTALGPGRVVRIGVPQ
ncbi:MAG: penicillin-binding transpeptidase domain-containing protein [Gemmatimonadaceae bacterium]